MVNIHIMCLLIYDQKPMNDTPVVGIFLIAIRSAHHGMLPVIISPLKGAEQRHP